MSTIGKNTVVSIFKTATNSKGESTNESLLYSNLEAFIEPLSSQNQPNFTGELTSEDFYFQTDNVLSNMNVGDRIEDSEGNSYSVAGIELWREDEVAGHTEATILLSSNFS